MQGIVFTGDRKLELREFAEPEPGVGEIVVKVAASGMCGTDLHHYRKSVAEAPAAYIAGHEPAGVVHSVGPGVLPAVAHVGQRVIVNHAAGCTACVQCRSGWPQMCTEAPLRMFGINDHGGHAPFLRVPAETVTPLDPGLSFEAGAAISCGTGTAWGALRRLGDIGGSPLVVFGQGPVGLSATMLAAARGASVIAVDIEPARLERARKFGATATVNSAVDEPVSAIRDLTGGAGSPLALETSGNSAAARAALESLALWGTGCFIGVGAKVELDVYGELRRQLTLMTSWTLSNFEQKKCADFILQNNLPVDDLFTHRWKLDQAEEAYQEFDRQVSGKGAFIFD
ncbi:zinc-binding dehydrogenase [Gordonia sp. LSe1-13]|uniref:Zinc-binding dehydrogenase n=1 Tax=Gordonia sesuvii TaxID=3116777 RepID=A0ABU7MKG8_9ACTN|nr:zinc-binding dehydrogenase [Gordonia sp. LSe1-13]